MKVLETLKEIRKFVWDSYLFKTNASKYASPMHELETQTLEDWSLILDGLINDSHPTYIDEVSSFLKKSSKLGLEVECIYSALVALKDDPTLSIKEAMNIGLDEWIK